MTAQEYRRLRVRVGSQAAVARKLGVDVTTVSRRERGAASIDREAECAIRWLDLERRRCQNKYC